MLLFWVKNKLSVISLGLLNSVPNDDIMSEKLPARKLNGTETLTVNTTLTSREMSQRVCVCVRLCYKVSAEPQTSDENERHVWCVDDGHSRSG